MSIININPSTLYDGSPFGLSQAKVDTTSGLIFVSGQVDWNANYEILNNDIEGQTKNAVKNLLTVLDEGGSAVESLLHLRIYVRGELGDHMAKVVPIIAEFLSISRPAITGIGVASLATPDTLIEIEAVARILT
ncbi:RidA family protein [Microbulbifer epialgicus]|uniref:RidA family protein n=1 Tax=Microbulbifer epialgicus TaxID=393907 RepID=A0ABV4P697_9GAMM